MTFKYEVIYVSNWSNESEEPVREIRLIRRVIVRKIESNKIITSFTNYV